MRIAALYDIHGNLPALEAVLRDVATAGVDCIVVGGDVVSGPFPRETLERLMALEASRTYFVRGNADREIVDTFEGRGLEDPEMSPSLREANTWVAHQLDHHHLDFLRRFANSVVLPLDDVNDAYFCHATPRNDTEIVTVRTPKARMREVLVGIGAARLVVCGHTHMAFDRLVGDVRVVNAGSVGMPYGEPGAHWALFGPERVELHRSMYDRHAAMKGIGRSGYPQASTFDVLSPPTATEALAVFDPQVVEEEHTMQPTQPRPQRHLGAYGVLISEGRVLLIRKTRGPYRGLLDLPGGGIEFGETPEEALRREFWEETGLRVTDCRLRAALSNCVRYTVEASGNEEELHHIGLIYQVAVEHAHGEATLKTEADGQDSGGALWRDASDIALKNQLSPFAWRALTG